MQGAGVKGRRQQQDLHLAGVPVSVSCWRHTVTAKGDGVWEVGDGRDPYEGKSLYLDSVGG